MVGGTRFRLGAAAVVMALVIAGLGTARASHCSGFALLPLTRNLARQLITTVVFFPPIRILPLLRIVTAPYYVSTSGSDATGDGTIELPWRTIQHAVETAIPPIADAITRTEIHVAPGTYEEHVTINRTLTVLRDDFQSAETPDQPVVVRGPTAGQWIVTVTAGFPTLQGLTIDGRSSRNPGIRVTGAPANLIAVTVLSPQGTGVRFENSPAFTLADSTLSTGGVLSDLGVDVDASQGTIRNLTAGNRFDHVINIKGVGSRVRISNSRITGSTIYYADGIRIQAPADVSIEKNRIERPTGEPAETGRPHNPPYAGIEVAFSGDRGARVDIKDNVVGGFDVGIGLNMNGNSLMAERNLVSGNVTHQVSTFVQGSAAPIVDLGHGSLGSCGSNRFIGGQFAFFHRAGYPVTAVGNDWGGPPAARIWDRADDSSLGTVTY